MSISNEEFLKTLTTEQLLAIDPSDMRLLNLSEVAVSDGVEVISCVETPIDTGEIK